MQSIHKEYITNARRPAFMVLVTNAEVNRGLLDLATMPLFQCISGFRHKIGLYVVPIGTPCRALGGGHHYVTVLQGPHGQATTLSSEYSMLNDDYSFNGGIKPTTTGSVLYNPG
jgi:hypothetical protein